MAMAVREKRILIELFNGYFLMGSYNEMFLLSDLLVQRNLWGSLLSLYTFRRTLDVTLDWYVPVHLSCEPVVVANKSPQVGFKQPLSIVDTRMSVYWVGNPDQAFVETYLILVSKNDWVLGRFPLFFQSDWWFLQDTAAPSCGSKGSLL